LPNSSYDDFNGSLKEKYFREVALEELPARWVVFRFLALIAAIVALLFFLSERNCSGAENTAHQKRVILTFDDGPKKEILEKLLPILDKEGIKVTFFFLGFQVKENPELVRKIHSAGHDIENHTWGHPRLDKLSLEKGIYEVERTSDLIERLTGSRPRFMRPPHMAIKKELKSALMARGYEIVGWSVGSMDWVYVRDQEKVFQQVKKEMDKRKSGTVNILFHETEWTVGVMPRIIKYLKDNGWSFVTLKGSRNGGGK
jgi:peptidoglycan/xylan/chitin deacetylase (PgdA/CDA1 family)